MPSLGEMMGPCSVGPNSSLVSWKTASEQDAVAWPRDQLIPTPRQHLTGYPRDLLRENKVAGPGLADAPPRRSVHSRAVTRLQRPPCYPGPPCPPKHDPDSTCRPGHVLTQTQPPQWLGWTAPTLICPVRSLVPEDFAQYHLHAKPLMDSPSQRRPECPTPHARANPQEPGYPKKQLLQRPPRLPVRS